MNTTYPRRVPVLATLVALVGASLAGCGGGGLTEEEVIASLEAAGLTVEKLAHPTWTRNQRERVEQKPETVFSLKLTSPAGTHQEVTLLGFDQEWKAEGVAPDGVPGFNVGTWFFVGQISEEFHDAIVAALEQ